MKLSDWMDFLTGLAILGGLIVVVWELQQNRALAEAELATQAYGQIQNRWQTLAGENSAAAVAKACSDPKSLSDAEVGVYWAYLQTQYFNMYRNVYVEGVAGFGSNIDEWIRSDMKYYLGSRLGRFDFDRYGESWHPTMQRIATELIENDAIVPCEVIWRDLTAAMRGGVDPRNPMVALLP
jgi:hypothetical protein